MTRTLYTHFIPQAPEDPSYEENLRHELVRDAEDLKSKLHLDGATVSWTIKATSLSPEEGEIVGIAWSTDGVTSFYCPVSHTSCGVEGAVELFVSELRKAKRSLLYSARDHVRLLEGYMRKRGETGDSLSFLRDKFIDVMNVVWIADTNHPLPTLKWASRHFLGYQPSSLSDTLSKEVNFKFAKVEDAFVCAGIEVLNIFNLFKVCEAHHEEAGVAAYLDTQASWIVGHLEETHLRIDTGKVRDLSRETEKELKFLENRIYQLSGERFNIRSERELTRVLLKLGIDTGERTRAGCMKTSKTLLKGYLERYPDTEILHRVIEYKEAFKFFSSYVEPILKLGSNQEKKPVRVSYKLQSADTTRLSCCSADTLIYTNHGIKKIVDLEEGDRVDDGTGTFYPAVLLDMGKRMLYTVSFSDGTVSHLTEDHKLLTVGERGYEWKELRDIKPKVDKICVKYNNWRHTERENLFYLLSALSYHAYLKSKNRLVIGSLRYGEVFYKKIKDILRRADIDYVTKEKDSPTRRSTPSITIEGNGYSNLRALLRETYGVQLEDALGRDSVNLEWVSSVRKAETVLECIYDLKIYQCNNPRTKKGFSNKSVDLLKDIKTILSFVGISSDPITRSSSKTVNRRDSLFFNTRSTIFYGYMQYAYTRHRFISGDRIPYAPDFLKKYILNHPVINYKLWRNEEGQSLMKQFKRYPFLNRVINFNDEFNLGLDIFYSITVDSVEPDRVDDTFTLSVDSEKHRFMSDSFISHNCGSESRNPFFSDLNVQAIPKPKPCPFYGRRATPEELDRKEDLLGWVFSPDHPEWSSECVSGMSTFRNIRDAFCPHRGRDDYFVSIDMRSLEANIATNLFREQYFAGILNSNRDIHRENSDRIFGANSYTKETRKLAKQALFGILYGQREYGFQQRFPYMSLEEARAFLSDFKALIPNIVRGQSKMISEAKRTGTIKSMFGHAIRVKSFFSSPLYEDRAFGERKVMNSPIQCCAAEVLKLELVRLWDNVFTRYPDVRFHSSIHDEISFSVPRELAEEVIPIMLKCMTVKLKDWLVPLTCSLSVGYTMGSLIPFVYNPDTKAFVPDWDSHRSEDELDTEEEDTEE